jgi:hypothetical protein
MAVGFLLGLVCFPLLDTPTKGLVKCLRTPQLGHSADLSAVVSIEPFDMAVS